MDCPAYRTLEPVARVLLIELRALYRPSAGAEVFLSVREAMQRVGVTQRPVQSAFKALLERGWIEEAKAGSFDQKTGTGRARSFLLTNIGPAGDHVDSKRTYMRWKPDASECQKNAVAPDATDRSAQHYTDQAA
jgi:DNA-binding transcriptional MocR family regulator